MTGNDSTGRRRAGLFDLRLILAVLFLLYGVIVLLVGLLSDSSDYKEKTGDINVNVWMGIAMLVVGALFAVWARLRPIVIPVEAEQTDEAGPSEEERTPGQA
jgi:hypothetical protein